MKIRGYAEHSYSCITVYTQKAVYTLHKQRCINNVGVIYYTSRNEDAIFRKMRDKAIEKGAQLETYNINIAKGLTNWEKVT